MDDRDLAAAVDAAGIAGAVALIGGRDGTRYHRAFGKANAITGTPMTQDAVFQIASMTKALTSVAAMQLVEQGRLMLDDPIGSILPDLGAAQVISGFDENDKPILRAPATPVTLRHLLTHTSGLGYDFISPVQLKARSGNAPEPGSLASIRTPLLFDPGTAWEYGVSTDWVGLAVEAVSGQTLGAYFAEHITGPLGMTATGFFDAASTPANAASIHARTPDGLMPVPMVLGDGEYNNGGGGLSSTGDDYMRFLRMLLNGGSLEGTRILAAETVADMCRNQVGSIAAGRMGSTMPEFAPPYDPFPGMDCGWGLGFLINPVTGPYGRSPGSLAWAGIFNCYYWFDPAKDVIGIFLAQLMPFGDPGVLGATAALERMAYRD